MTLHNQLHVTCLAGISHPGKCSRNSVKRERVQPCCQRELVHCAAWPNTLHLAILGCLCGEAGVIPQHHPPSCHVLCCVFETSRPGSPGNLCVFASPALGSQACATAPFSCTGSEMQLPWPAFANSAIHPHSRVPRMKMLWKINKGTFLIY